MSSLSLPVATLGTPRIGPRRELKTALESFWSGKSDAAALLETAAALRAANWARQHALGVTVIPSNDFSFYDQVLDTSVMVGAIPAAYGWAGGPVPLATTFAMARGSQADVGDAACSHGPAHGHGVPAQEMTKWFDTNYHYMVPEFAEGQRFALSSLKPVEEYREAKAVGTGRARCCWARLPSSSSARAWRTRCPCWTACCRSMPKCCSTWPPRGRSGCRSTSPAWCWTSTTRPVPRCAAPMPRWPRRRRS
jgi:hypothetical protein